MFGNKFLRLTCLYTSSITFVSRGNCIAVSSLSNESRVFQMVLTILEFANVPSLETLKSIHKQIRLLKHKFE